MAEDVTLFVDDSVACEGPPVDGPTLHDWAQRGRRRRRCAPGTDRALRRDPRAVGDVVPDSAGAVRLPRLVPSAGRRGTASAGGGDHAPRRGNRSVRRRRPADDRDGRRLVDRGRRGRDVLGHLDALPDDTGTELAAFADERGLAFVPCGHTAEQDLSVLAPGADVLVVGFGQAFTDLVALVDREGEAAGSTRRATATSRTSRAGSSRCSTSARAAACPTGRS